MSALPTIGEGRQPTTRDRLLDAAYELLVEEGYRSTTVHSVARRAGLSNGSAVYSHFVTKDELVVEAVLRHGFDGHEAARGLDDVVIRLARHLSAPPMPTHRALTEVAGAAIGNGLTRSELRAAVQRLQSTARRVLDGAKAPGITDQRSSTDALTMLIVDLYLGAIASKALGRPQPPFEDVLRVLRVLVDPVGRVPSRRLRHAVGDH